MTSNIFISFDPFISSSLKFSEVFFLLPLFLIAKLFPFSYLANPSALHVTTNCLLKKALSVCSETKSVSLKGCNHILCTVFAFIIGVNIVGILPFSFCYSASMSLVVVVSFPIWFSLVASAWIKSFKQMGGSMVPFGSPLALSPLLSILEVVSVFIRPISLSLRLMANMVAGHCLLTNLSQISIYLFFAHPAGFFVYSVFYFFYFCLEICICLVQAYIFFSLLSLYSNDHPG